jgi:catechol 2,3-dioxygenase-like lactoylglutathione lyase family enzyme
MIKRFWHTGFGVKDLEKAIVEYETLGFKVMQRFEKTEPRSIAVHMDHHNGSSIELFQFFDEKHPQVEFIKQHMAFVTDNIDEDIKKLESEGCEVVKHFAFLRDQNGQYIELAETGVK